MPDVGIHLPLPGSWWRVGPPCLGWAGCQGGGAKKGKTDSLVRYLNSVSFPSTLTPPSLPQNADNLGFGGVVVIQLLGTPWC